MSRRCCSTYQIILFTCNHTNHLSNRADINQRTGRGKFKKVMWYRERLGYGNDLIGQRLAPWKTGQEAQYAAFADRLLPGGSSRTWIL